MKPLFALTNDDVWGEQVPVKKGWMKIKRWKEKKHKDKLYFVVDKRGLHYFQGPKDVIFDGKVAIFITIDECCCIIIHGFFINE